MVNLDLSHVTSPEGLELPDEVTEILDLSGLTSAEGLRLLRRIGRDLHLLSLAEDEDDHEVHGPGDLGGEVHWPRVHVHHGRVSYCP